MRRHRTTLPMLLCLAATLISFNSVNAIPPLPSSFYGTVELNGLNLSDGTLVEALIDERVVAFTHTLTYEGDSVFALSVPGDDPDTTPVEGGTAGAIIQFRVGGLLADQTGTWRSGTNLELNITVTSSSTPAPPGPTNVPPLTQTAISLSTPTAGVLQVSPSPETALSPGPTIDMMETDIHSTAIATETGRDPTANSSDGSPAGEVTENQTDPDQDNAPHGFTLVMIIVGSSAVILFGAYLVFKKLFVK